MSKYIWQMKEWPAFRWKADEIQGVLSEVSYRQGRFLGELSSIGFDLQNHTGFEAISAEILSSAAIEGEILNMKDVRSSVARRMEIVLSESGAAPSHTVDARVEMMMDATRGWYRPLTEERLFSWHAALFPTGYSGLNRIRVAAYRDDRDGPMQVVSRRGTLLRVHFEAPPAKCVDREVRSFLSAVNEQDDLPPLVRIALAHLRFLTVHPFEDGNGRLARTLTEWMLARCERSELRFYSLSSQIQREKDDYYAEIEHAQRNSLDLTRWIKWFLGCHCRAIDSAAEKLSSILFKARFWQSHAADDLNVHQRQMLNRLLDDFEGNLTSSKWAKICKVSQDTASREIKALTERGILRQEGAGRSTHFLLA